MGSRKGSDCGASAHNLTLCRDECTPEHNATMALESLRREGGSAVATSMFLYCGVDINASGHVVLKNGGNISAGCAIMIPELNAMGIGAEPVLGGSLSALRSMFASPTKSIDALVALTKAHKLRGISWDVEPSGSSPADASNFARYLGALRVRLAPLGARVTVYSNAYSRMISDMALLAASADRVLDGDCYNGGSWDGWLSKYDKLLAHNINRSRVAPAMMASTERGDWNCENASISQRYEQVVKDGIEEIAIFTYDPMGKPGWGKSDCTTMWLPYARLFLAGAAATE